MIKRYRYLFKKYIKLKNKQNQIIALRPRGTSGILVDSDARAKEYQSFTMKFELIESALEGRLPNWFKLCSIDSKEAKRRIHECEKNKKEWID